MQDTFVVHSSGAKLLRSRRLSSLLMLTGALGLSACSGGSNSPHSVALSGGLASTDLQNPPAAGPVNTYVGTQTSNLGASRLSGGDWGLVIDTNAKTLNYVNPSSESILGLITYDAGNSAYQTPLPGPLLANYESASTGWLTLQGSGTGVGSNGYALEIPGRAALLRPGDPAQALVLATQTSGCLNLAQPTTFQFIGLGTPFAEDGTPHVAYGSVAVSMSPTPASTSSTQPGHAGIVSHFTSLTMNDMTGAAIAASTIPDGVCGQTQMGFAISIPQPAGSPLGAQTAAIGPSGFFVLDQAQGSPYLITGDPNINYPTPGSQYTLPGPPGPLGLVGVLQPGSAVDTAKLAGARYLGFETSASLAASGKTATSPIAMGPSGGGLLVGGRYPNDDVTQPAFSNITIDLGQQDASAGLFKSVTVTLPDVSSSSDTNFNGGMGPLCAGQPDGGVGPAGAPVCVFHGVAVVGQPEGKFAIFVTVTDPSLWSLATRQFVLYQQ